MLTLSLFFRLNVYLCFSASSFFLFVVALLPRLPQRQQQNDVSNCSPASSLSRPGILGVFLSSATSRK